MSDEAITDALPDREPGTGERRLIVLCGLPGVGKSAVAEALGRALPAPVLSVDPVEAALWRAGVGRDQPTGVAACSVVMALTAELLALGQRVVIDAVNHAPAARAAWPEIALTAGTGHRFVEVRCPDEVLHRRRLEARHRRLEGYPKPSWASVQARRAAFQDWPLDRLVLDSTRPVRDLLLQVLEDLDPVAPGHLDTVTTSTP
ncbi:MAG: AAA family ATPase [Janthinobacterium lividum]